MLKQAENDVFTRVGPGTPAGELLRRYWHPVAMAAELSEESPTKAVTLLGEKLVVFRLPPASGESQPRYGLMEEQCAHRLASLAYGTVDSDGIRCPYHGWKYDLAGNCIEQPAEPPESNYKSEIHLSAYPVQKFAGLLWAYMGPLPAPLLPRWDVLAREDGVRSVSVQTDLDCNWLQAMENSVDPAHFYFLHGVTFKSARTYMEVDKYRESSEFIRFEYGIMKRRITPAKSPGERATVDEHPLVFPNTLRNVFEVHDSDIKNTPEGRTALHDVQIRVPIDDVRTRVYWVRFIPSSAHRSSPDQDHPYDQFAHKDANGRYNFDLILAQDSMAWETQGAIADRSREHLAASDRGVIMLRKLLKEQIEIVRKGGDPMGVVRDPAKNKIIVFDVINERIGVFRSEKQSPELSSEVS
ncbi:MAG: Rieske (2Fe-2S) domain protein [Noviherbaspirillum sp.]|nr:Rieske (2Fe-2S) domain protein [Noviherbaspirillum sp.]